ncbi:MAG: sodium:solute symporter family transporter [Clostridia bacterium]|jgi:SSS family solute:Na+ symporter
MKYVFLFAFIALMAAIGIISRKKVKNIDDFFLGGRNIGPWISAFSYGASYFSAVIFIGYAGKIGWEMGFSAVWIGIFNALIGTYLAWAVLGKKARDMTRRLEAKTMPEFFEKRYNSKNMKMFSALMIFIFLVPYSASVYKGLGYLFESVFNIPFIYCTLGMALLTGLYIMLGGYVASALNDFIQGIIMLAGAVIMVVYVVNSPQVGGITNAYRSLAQIESAKASLVGPNPASLLGLIILTSLGTWGLPQMVHKFYAIKDGKGAIRRGRIISTIFALVIGVSAYGTGTFGPLFFNTVPDGNFDKIVPMMLTQSAAPDLFLGLITVLVLSASMSTLASLVLVSGSAITIDLGKGVIYKNMSKKFEVNLMRIICVLFVAASFIISVSNPSAIVTLMSLSWGALAGSFIAPFLYGLWNKKATAAGAWASMITGLSVMVICVVLLPLLSGSNPGGVVRFLSAAPNAGSLAMILSLIVMPVTDRVAVAKGVIEAVPAAETK